MKPPVRLAAFAGGLVIAGLSVYSWHRWPICPMQAVTSDSAPEPRLHERPIAADEIAAFAAVLAKYGEPYSERADGILITPRLYFDRELRWNYTSKR
jgi:hypothetical protein